jgi:purine-nucleoside/S-methyl-5'-thioadenosine phosphorylase / adenosine deaminase
MIHLKSGVTLPKVDGGEWRSAAGQSWWEAACGPASIAFTTRWGGVSASPYDTLNLGLHVGDEAAAVSENRRALWSVVAPGASPPIMAEQVHGTHAAVVGAADSGRGWSTRDTAMPDTDALVSREAGVALAILVADCAPVALVAPEGVLAVAHAGWRGLAGGVIEATLQRMAGLGAGPPREYQAVVGPCIRACCYEIGEEVWRHFPNECLVPAKSPHARQLDLMAAVAHRLQEAGLPLQQIRTFGLCTACHPELFFSHRRATQQGNPTTGRMALFARLSQ